MTTTATMDFDTTNIDLAASFIYFVYPFTFDSHQFDSLTRAGDEAVITGQQQPKKEQECRAAWEKLSFPEEELLFHVANYLKPGKNSSCTARFWQSSPLLHQSFGFSHSYDWQLVYPNGEISFVFGEENKTTKVVQLMLFRVGVGFVTVKAQPKSDRVNDWLKFIHYFRFLRGQRGTHLNAQRRTGLNPHNRQTQLDIYFPELAGGKASYKDGKPTLGNLLTTILSTLGSTQWWQEIFVSGQMLPFAAIYADGLPYQHIYHLLYKLQNFFHGQQGQHPAPENLDPQAQPWLTYALRQWFVFTLEGGSFLAVDAPNKDFFRTTLPNHLQTQYFLLFLLALHQRFALMSLSAQVADSWVTDGATRLRRFEAIRDRLLLFTARGYFTQVMQREHHHRCYRQWQKVFQLETLYQEISEEVQEMHEYVQTRQNQNLERTIQVVGVAVGAGGIAASSTAGYIQQPITLVYTGNIHPGFLALLASLAIGAIAGCITWWLTGWLKPGK